MARLDPDRFPEQWREVGRVAEQNDTPDAEAPPAGQPAAGRMTHIVLILRCVHHPERIMRGVSEDPPTVACQEEGCTTSVTAQFTPVDQLAPEVLAEITGSAESPAEPAPEAAEGRLTVMNDAVPPDPEFDAGHVSTEVE